MFVICQYYCGSFFQWLFFFSTALLFLVAAFVFKRGMKQGRVTLRKRAFVLIYIALFKFLLMDSGFIANSLFCNSIDGHCDAVRVHIFKVLSFVAIVPASFIVHMFYKKFIDIEILARRTVRGMWIRFWSNISMFFTLLLAIWLIAPWVSYLIYGSTPDYFLHYGWKLAVTVCYTMILVTFWRYEDCSIAPQSDEDKDFNMQTWVPRDTLWLALALLAITHSFFIMSIDFLSNG